MNAQAEMFAQLPRRGRRPGTTTQGLVSILNRHADRQVGWTKESLRGEIQKAGVGITPDKLQKLGLDFLADKANVMALDMKTDDGLQMWVVTDQVIGQREHIFVLVQTVEGRYAIRQYAKAELGATRTRALRARALIRYCDRIESAYGADAPAA